MQTHGKQSLHRAVPRGSQTHRVTYSYPRFLLGFEMSYYVTAVLPTQELNSFATESVLLNQKIRLLEFCKTYSPPAKCLLHGAEHRGVQSLWSPVPRAQEPAAPKGPFPTDCN